MIEQVERVLGITALSSILLLFCLSFATILGYMGEFGLGFQIGIGLLIAFILLKLAPVFE